MSEQPSANNDFIPLLIQEWRKFSAALVIYNEGVAAKLHLNATDLKCRELLNQTGPITAGQLAQLTNLTTGAITGVIDRLEKAELVKRVPDPQDRRRVIIQPLSDRDGEIRELFKPLHDSLSRLFQQYSEEELRLILDMLLHLNEMPCFQKRRKN
ncbi:winged helix DNA-binding domain protein [Anoxybacillus sp. B7M1]|jgi:DNA-binding MarR family transcriptional regulator|uniref:MarR family winged helix-turn-helix transcriptional regulator n=1 Tax=Anoxybacillaceae TaxID=3120669 RepID=UPI0005CCACC9|nr:MULTISPECIES: MarR family transcriptional regulator [Anoxybacillus]ANB55506.1 winged helix DNA-binding domain protein [Anoxybacillus sp. B2M1]ANB63437.1 winged helix DNA-binding domain protein [Anoxybacillus sp. B7M1]KXG08602.1 HTH-type transcriptional regulator MhqR [Anoxybacillus sp. P3H1B]MBS2772342.1 MarR family transcriptional regulator [Anoxybacillus rupiensis]